MDMEFGHSQRILLFGIVMLSRSEASHRFLADGERPFAAAQGDIKEVNGVTPKEG
jgi:hypothetical protein